MNLPKLVRVEPDRADLAVLFGLYVVAVTSFWIAFAVVTTDREIALFIIFAVVGLLGFGVAAPVAYTVIVRRRPLASLGVTTRHLRLAIVLGVVLAVLQFVFTLWGYDLPAAVDWVPLLLMSVVVGLFEAIFFRGFMQLRLEASFGLLPAIVLAAGFYSLYHVGYEMGAGEMFFLFGLGLLYAIAFRLVSNILVLWPLLTPLGAFYNNLEAGDIELPWLSMLGFGEVLVGMFAILLIAAWKTRDRGTAKPRTEGTAQQGPAREPR